MGLLNQSKQRIFQHYREYLNTFNTLDKKKYLLLPG